VDFDKLNKWLTLLANLGVVVGIVFLAFEIRSNTASNRIAIQSAFSSNWVDINGGIAHDRQLATLIEKTIAGEELDAIEHRQIHHYVRQLASQAALMRRLYVEGFATKNDVRNAYRSFEAFVEYDGFREEFRDLGDTNRKIILEPNGLEDWFESVD
jgi:hypothetical protein